MPLDMTVLAQRQFSLGDQLAFAQLSGDYNPIHIDPAAARRSLAGACIVHGMHAVLWALHAAAIVPATLRVKFLKPMFLDETVFLQHDDDHLAISNNEAKLIDIQVRPTSAMPIDTDAVPPLPYNLPLQPIVRTFAELQACRGALPLGLSDNLFPNLPPSIVADLAALSRLVGMGCPGLYSMFSSCQLDFTEMRQRHSLSYRVVEADARFRRIEMEVAGAVASGTVTAFVRPPPIAEAQIDAIAPLVGLDEFIDQQVLIIGGSRGLGAAAARLLAAGGADVTITYAASADAAAKVVADISAFGGRCRSIPYTVPGDDPAFLPPAAQVYYFATPKIFGKRGVGIDPTRLARFRAIYVDGFARLLGAISRWPQRTVAYYPSSTAIDAPLADLTEYVTAKLEGEALCEAAGHNVIMSRLPRIATDQTQSLIAVPAADPVAVMLPIIRDMQAHWNKLKPSL